MATTKKATVKSRRTTTLQENPQETATGPICVVPDCDKPVYVRGLCADHWADPKA